MLLAASVVVWFAVALGALTAAVSAGVIWFATRRLSRLMAVPRTPALERADVVAPGPDDLNPLAIPSLGAGALPVLDYIDSDGLTALATELGVNVDPIRSTTAHEHRQDASVEGRLAANVRVPGLGEVQATAGGAGSSAEFRSAALSIERRSSFREIMIGLCQALAEADRLRLDLARMPNSRRSEQILSRELLRTYSEVAAAGTTESEESSESPSGTAENSEEASDVDSLKDVAEAMDVVWQYAMMVVVDAKENELEAIAEGGTNVFALISIDWSVDVTDTSLELYNDELMSHPDEDPALPVIIRRVLRVPLNEARLTDIGRVRLNPGSIVAANVFGRVAGFDEEDRLLNIAPLAIYSA